MQCDKHETGYCEGEVEHTLDGKLCVIHKWHTERCKTDSDRMPDSEDGYGLQLYDNVMFGEVEE
jgi:hypothetical protein